MTTSHDSDRQFDENLQQLAGQVSLPAGPSRELVSRCIETIESPVVPLQPRFRWGRAALVSTLSAAAVLALAGTILFPWKDTSVNAAMILSKFDAQMKAGRLIDLTFKSVQLDDASIDGRISIGDESVAGDMRLSVKDEEQDPSMELDFVLGLSPESKWILVRRLSGPDVETNPFLNMFFPPRSQTLITLPEVEDGVIAAGVETKFADGLNNLNCREVFEVLERVVHENMGEGAAVTTQADGTVLLRLPLDNDAVFESLRDAMGHGAIDLSMKTGNHGATVSNDTPKSGFGISFSFDRKASVSEIIERETAGKDAIVIKTGAKREAPAESTKDKFTEFAGSVIEILYDPASETVRSVDITQIGPAKGSISIKIGDGQIDPSLLKSESLTTPETRQLDLKAIASMFKSSNGADDDQE